MSELTQQQAEDIAKALGDRPEMVVPVNANDSVAPASWLLTVELPDRRCIMGAIKVHEPLHPDDLAGVFQEAMQEKGGICGHACNLDSPDDWSTIYFGIDAERTREHREWHKSMEAKREQRFGS